MKYVVFYTELAEHFQLFYQPDVQIQYLTIYRFHVGCFIKW